MSSSPTPTRIRRHPVNSKGVPWYVDFRGNRLGSVDPVTMEIRIPVAGSGSASATYRADADDVVWYTDFAAAIWAASIQTVSQGLALARRAQVGAGRHCHRGQHRVVQRSAVSRTRGAIRSQDRKFPTWVIPSGGGVVRNMMGDAERRSGVGVQRCQSRGVGRGRDR